MNTSIKPDFTAKSFYALMDNFSSKYTSTENRRKADWQTIVRNEFALTGEQDKSISDCSKSQASGVQKSFDQINDHIKNGGHIKAMILQEKDKSHSINIFLGNQSTPGGSIYMSIVIASCDANCRHWRWGRGRRR